MLSRLPKVLHSLGGKPLLEHVLLRAQQLEADRTIVVYGHGGESVPAAFAGRDIVFARQEPLLGTGHALRCALPHLLRGGSTLVLYGDVPLLQKDTLLRLCAKGMTYRLLTCRLDDPSGYGRIRRNKQGRIIGIVEEKDATTRERSIAEVNTGTLCAPTDALARWLEKLQPNNAQKEYYLTDTVALAVTDGLPVESVEPAAQWEIFGVNSKEQLAQLERVYQLNQARGLMAAGVTLADPWRIDIRGEVACGQDVFIDINSVFEGSVTLGDNVRVGAHCVLRDVEIGAGTVIAPFSHLESSTVGKLCQVGPFSRLRPGVKLNDEVRIGNFVELKATELGKGSKANHLTYLGDTTVGQKVNIGAGTVTCNYDGVNKHKTIIDDEAFIGSDVMLVAPLRIGKGATIGAGSTITRDAPPDMLTLARSNQSTIPGWKRPTKKLPDKKSG